MSEAEYPAFPIIDGVEFKHIPKAPGYIVGSNGSIWSCRGQSKKAVKVWKQRRWNHKNKKDRPRLNYWHEGKHYVLIVSRLVAEAFIGPIPDGYDVAHFPDSDVFNNNVTNLKIATRGENIQDRKFHGTYQFGENNPAAYLTESIVKGIRQLHAEGMKQAEIVEATGLKQSQVSALITNKLWKHVT